MAQQSSPRPTNKVIAGSIGAAIATIIIYVVERWLGEPLPLEVTTAATSVVSFGLAYLMPPSEADSLELS